MQYLHRIISALLLLAYVSTGTSMLPALTLVLEQAEGSHEVKIRQTSEGTQVLLHHARCEHTPEVSDHKSALTRFIVRMCRPDAQGDHSLCLSKVAGAFVNSSSDAKRDLKATAAVTILSTPSGHERCKAADFARAPEAWSWQTSHACAGAKSHILVATTRLLI